MPLSLRIRRGRLGDAAIVVVAISIAMPSGVFAQSFPSSGEAVIGAMHQRYADTWYETVAFTETATRRTPADTMVTETWKEALLIPGRLRINVEGSNPKLSYICRGDSFYIAHGDSVTRLSRRNLLLLMGFECLSAAGPGDSGGAPGAAFRAVVSAYRYVGGTASLRDRCGEG